MSKGKFALGAFFGAIVGAAAGILTAPKSGKETRADLAAKTSEVAGEVSKKAAEAANDVSKTTETAIDQAGEVYKDVKVKATTAASNLKDEANDLKSRTGRAVEGAKKGFFSEK